MQGWAGIDEFVAVAKTGSFSAAARLLGLSTTHMSRAVAGLEQRLETTLFNRTTRTVKLTDTGLLFYDHCQRIVAERDEAIAMIHQGSEPQGELRVTCSIAMGERFIVPIIQEFALRNSRLTVAIDLTNRAVDLIGEGYDLAIRTGKLADSSLVATRIAARTLATCASPAYLAQHGRPVRLEDLGAHDCVVSSSPLWHFQRGGRPAVFRPKGRWRCNSGVAAVKAAIAGLGLCQLPAFYVLPHIASGELEPLLASFTPEDEPIWAVYPQVRHAAPKITGLVDLLRQRLPAALALTA
jgi:DNA-binding transcriptional LysR family regulator